MSEAVVTVDGHDAPMIVRLNGDTPTFTLQTDRVDGATQTLEDRLHDFLEIAATVFAADSGIARGGKTRAGMGRDWRRGFSLHIPVRDLAFWSSPEVTQKLSQTASFLTEDRFDFTFAPRAPDEVVQRLLDLWPDGPGFKANEVILFSGGLDSYAGALEALSTRSGNVILVSHQSAQKVISRQNDLAAYLRQKFPGRVLHIPVRARRVGEGSRDSNQRSRSLLFTALALAVAQSFEAQTISFYENGFVSHNLPFSPQIIGTMASRTTHPLGLKLLDDLAQMIATRPVPIRNQYEWHTKREVVEKIKLYEGEANIARAVSCTSVREQDTLHTHCGACTQCLDRRFAILAAGLEAFDPEECYHTDVLVGARKDDRSRTLAIDWTRHSHRLADSDQQAFLLRYSNEVLRIIRAYPDTERRNTLSLIFGLHRRHSTQVRKVLASEFSKRSAAIVDQSLPPNALLSMFMAGLTEASQLELAVARPQALGGIPDDLDGTDLVPDHLQPLRVCFLEGSNGKEVAVLGLGRLTGNQASIPWALWPVFEEDRKQLIDPEAHRFVPLATLGDLNGKSKDAIRKLVQRSRKTLEGFYREVHGFASEGPILIHGKGKLGHRLDPSIQIASQNQP